MRDETDLRTAIDTLAGPRPEAEALYARLVAELTTDPERPSTRGRVFVPLLAAAVVAVLALAGVLVAGVGDRRDNQSGGDGTVPLTWRFSVGRVSGFTVVRDGAIRSGDVDTGVTEYADITATGGGSTSGLLVFDTDPGRTVTTGRSFVMDGVRYFYRAGGHVARQGGLTERQYSHDPWRAAGQDEHGPQLAWHYADGSQFTVSGTFGFRPKRYDYDNSVALRDLVRIARAVRAGRTDVVRMPFGPAALPGRLTPVFLRYAPPGTVTSPRAPGGALTVNACITYSPIHRPMPRKFIQGVLTVCRITVGSSERAALNAVLPPDQVGLRVVRRLADGTMLAVASGSGTERTIPRAVLTRVAAHTEVSPKLDNPSTWLSVG